MFKHIKEAKEAVKSKNENIELIKVLKKNKSSLDKEIKKLDEKIRIKKKLLERIELKIERKTEEEAGVQRRIDSLKATYRKLFQDEEFKLKEQLESHKQQLEANSRKIEPNKQKWELELDERNRIYHNLVVLLKEIKKKKENDKITEDETKSELHINKEINSLMDNFIAKNNTFVLAIPTVIDHILECIERDKEGEWIYIQGLGGYSSSQSEGWYLYKNKISTFFSLLTKKGYATKGKEGAYLTIMKEKSLEKHYEEVEIEFQPLLQLNSGNSSYQEVMFLFIQMVGKEGIKNLGNLSFLNRYLVKNGFLEEEIEYEELYQMVNKEIENYKVTKLEKELLEVDGNQGGDKLKFNDIELLNGRDFEIFLVDLLNNLGFRAEITKSSGDQGVDILAKKKGKTYAVQAKRYSGTVGNKAIQEVVSGKEYYDADITWVITNSSFTKSAIDLAAKTNTILWDGSKLKNMMEIADM